MAKRPTQHVLEEKSVRAFTNLIPADWVVRPVVPDYGYDLYVQPFINGASTNLFFFVQLKSRGPNKRKSKSMQRRLRTDRLEEYLLNPNPVMIVAYDATTGKTYFEWTHDWASKQQQLLFGPFASKTTTIRIERQLTKASAAGLISEIRARYRGSGNQTTPGSLTLSLVCSGGTQEQFIAQILSHWLKNARTLKEGNPSEATIAISANELTATWADKTRTIPRRAYNTNDEFIVACKLLILDLLDAAYATDIWRELATDLIHTTGTTIPQQLDVFILRFGHKLAQQNRPADVLLIAETLCSRQQWRAAVHVMGVAIQHRNCASLLPRLWPLLASAIEHIDDASERGTYIYNLSFNLATHGQTRHALKELMRAATLKPQLAELKSWAYQLVTLLSRTQYPRLASLWSRYLVAIQENAYTVALAAKCAASMGKLGEALSLMKSADKLANNSDPSIVTMLNAYERLRAEHGERVRRHRGRADEFLTKAIAASTAEESEMLIAKGVCEDPLHIRGQLLQAQHFSLLNERASFRRWLQMATLANAPLIAWVPIVADLVELEEEFSLSADLVSAVLRHVMENRENEFLSVASELVGRRLPTADCQQTIEKIVARYLLAKQRFPRASPVEGTLEGVMRAIAYPDEPAETQADDSSMRVVVFRK